MAFDWLMPWRKKEQGPVRYGDFTTRLLAMSIDILLCLLIATPLFPYMLHVAYGDMDVERVMWEVRGLPEDQRAAFLVSSGYLKAWLVNNVLQAALLSAYFLGCWLYMGNTPGKKVFGLLMVDRATLQAPSKLKLLVRFAGYFLSALPLTLGFLWIGFNKEKRGWHDMLAGTLVIKDPLRRDPVEWVKDKCSRKKSACVNSTPPSAAPSNSPEPEA